jgi:hypothetical protein
MVRCRVCGEMIDRQFVADRIGGRPVCLPCYLRLHNYPGSAETYEKLRVIDDDAVIRWHSVEWAGEPDDLPER